MRLNDVFVVSEKYKELTDKVQPLVRFKEYPLVMLEQKTVARKALDNYLKTLGIELSPSIEVGGWDLMKRLVIRGMGIGCIPREYAEYRLADGSMFEIKTDPVLPARSVAMALPASHSPSYALRAFIDMFN
jgi:DNA-binding transcriptional LysR family regulator